MYGGRVIDDFDRRVVNTYMDEYMGDFIFDTFQPFHFYVDESVDYSIPKPGNEVEEPKKVEDKKSKGNNSKKEGIRPDCNRDVYMDIIESLPLSNTPNVFGLHANAEIGYYTSAAKDIWAHLVELQPQTGVDSGGISREEFIGKIASDIQSKLPQQYDVPQIKKQISEMTPTTIVLLQELDRFNVLISKMATTLMNLQRVHTCFHTNLQNSVSKHNYIQRQFLLISISGLVFI